MLLYFVCILENQTPCFLFGYINLFSRDIAHFMELDLRCCKFVFCFLSFKVDR